MFKIDTILPEYESSAIIIIRREKILSEGNMIQQNCHREFVRGRRREGGRVENLAAADMIATSLTVCQFRGARVPQDLQSCCDVA